MTLTQISGAKRNGDGLFAHLKTISEARVECGYLCFKKFTKKEQLEIGAVKWVDLWPGCLS